MNVDIHRMPSVMTGTFGILAIDNVPVCVTCEDPWYDNAVAVSCIPPGKYTCEKFSGERFKDVWEVKNVPGRSAILIHSGNTINDTHGCILVGNGFGILNGLPSVVDSLTTLNVLRRRLPATFTLTVRS